MLSIRTGSCLRRGCRRFVVAVMLLGSIDTVLADPAALRLAIAGTFQCGITVAPNASSRVLTAAAELADMLGRMTGGSFPVTAGDGTAGLAVGVLEDFPTIDTGITPLPDDPLQRERYRLRTHAQGAWLIGASEGAVDQAVWDFLHRLGYRLYFLTDHWEIVPNLPDASIALDETIQPDYHTRQAPRGAPWSDSTAWNRWLRRNRIAPTFSLNTGHAYDGIISANAAVFATHPEYFALVDGVRNIEGGNRKFCISNDGLRALIADYAIGVMLDDPARDSLSMDPSDGGGWCECLPCAEMGSVSDRVLWLANDVAAAINAIGLGPRFVGMYAYNEHSPPPSITAHPNVIVSIATSFIRGGYTIEQLVEGWQAQGATTGIREYHDVFTWSHDLPRRARGGNLAYLQRTIPYFHDQSARFMNSEASDSWGANGLGYWLSPQLLWDVDNADRIDSLIDDFLVNAFGAAEPVMREFYHFLHWDRSLQTDQNVIARLYAMLAAAYPLTSDPAVRKRLDDLTLYTRYVELYHRYRSASGEARQAGFEAVLRHVWRMRDRMMQSTRAIYDRDQFRDSTVEVPPEAAWGVPEPDNPWKDSAPYSEAEIATLLTDGMQAYPVDEPDFEPVAFSRNLVPPTPLHPPALPVGTATLTDRGARRYLTWLDAPDAFDLEVTGGLIAHYRDRGNVRIRLSHWRNDAFEEVFFDASVPPDGQTYTVTLLSPRAGLHALDISDGSDQTRIVQPAGLPLTYYAPMESPEAIPGTWTLYVFVPEGTPVVGGFASSLTGRLRDGYGNLMIDFTTRERPGYFSVPVPAGHDGMFWKLESCTGHRIMMTIPPCLAKTPSELLLPIEVVNPLFAHPIIDPDTLSVTGITHQAAWLTGSLLSTGAAPSEVTLDWGPEGQWTGQAALGWTTAATPFGWQLTGLSPATRYRFRAQASNAYGQTWSDIIEFATANALPFHEPFDTRAPGLLHLQHGWTSDPAEAAVVQSEITSSPDSALACRLTQGRVSQNFDGFPDGSNVVWTDLRLQPLQSDPPGTIDDLVIRSLDADAAETAVFYVDYATGYIVVFDGPTALALTNQPAVPPGAWARFTVRSDYANRLWDLWLDGESIARNLQFHNSGQERFTELIVVENTGGGAASMLDHVSINLEWSGRPAGIAFLDDDGDGICDDWERFYFGSTSVASGAATDYDGNAFPDKHEFLAGTDPTDPLSMLAISDLVRLPDGQVNLRWQSAAERAYTLLTRTCLQHEAWAPHVSNIPATPPENTLRLAPPDASPVFYRIRLDLPLGNP